MTKEEIKAAVLAEFRQVCLRPMYFYPVDNDTRLIFNGTQYEIYIGLNCLLSLSVVGENKNTDWLAAYRLLGLEAKAKDAEIAKLADKVLNYESKISEMGVIFDCIRGRANGAIDTEDYLNDATACLADIFEMAVEGIGHVDANAMKGGAND